MEDNDDVKTMNANPAGKSEIEQELSDTAQKMMGIYDEEKNRQEEFFKQAVDEENSNNEDSDEEDSDDELVYQEKELPDWVKHASVIAAICISLTISGISLLNIIKALQSTDITLLPSPIPLMAAFFTDIVVFTLATALEGWNYDNLKRLFIIVLLSLFGVELLFLLVFINMWLAVPFIASCETGEIFTELVREILIEVTTIIIPCIITMFVLINMLLNLFEPNTLRLLCDFRINMYVDFRKGKKFKYDSKIMRRRSNRRIFVYQEASRYLHCLIIGVSGGGKSSAVLLPMINGDLNTRVRNEDMMKKLMYEQLKLRNIRLRQKTADQDFCIDLFEGTNKDGKIFLSRIVRQFRLAGVTVIAPDDSLTDSAYSLCLKKGIRCNRVDPLPNPKGNGKRKNGYKGFNPLYISPRLPKYMLIGQIVQRATLAADVMQQIFNLKGKPDPYFSSINRSMTVAVSICLSVTMPIIDERQPNLRDVQYIIGKYSRIKPYYDKLVEVNRMLEGDDSNAFGFVIDFIEFDMLGDGKDSMMQQARGLRTLLNEFLTNPDIKRALCPSDKDTVDMDQMLANGEITVVNYALELGDTDSKGFGLFFLLSFIYAVYRRSGAFGSNVAPHILIIDELPVILHPIIENAISLFRKYKVSIVMCAQSLDQMSKTEETRNLMKIVLGGAATHYVFGRSGITEMDLYQKVSGKKHSNTKQVSITETISKYGGKTVSVSRSDNPRLEDRISGDDIRHRRFLEATVYNVLNGNIIPAFVAKFSFLKKKDKKRIKRKKYDWNKYFCTDEQEDDDDIILDSGWKGHTPPSEIPGNNVESYDFAGLIEKKRIEEKERNNGSVSV